DADSPVAVHLNVIYAGAQLELAAERAKLTNEVFQYQANTGVRTAHAFQVKGSKHDAELAPIHVALAGVAVPHRGAEQHLDQQRVGDDPGQDVPRAELENVLAQVVIVENLAKQALEVVALAGKGA